jgi:hypothetical protein
MNIAKAVKTLGAAPHSAALYRRLPLLQRIPWKEVTLSH